MVDDNKEILKRLDTIVFLLLELKDRDGKMSLKEKIRLLNDTGLDYHQIANVLGKKPGNIAVQLTMLKNEKKKTAEQDTPQEVQQNE